LTDGRSQVGYERSDAPPRLVALLASGLAVTVALVLLALAIAFPSALSPASRGPAQPLPPAPQLQTDPAGDLLRYKSAEEQQLKKRGAPIEQAMNAVAAEGWSERQ
jgi:hypothetical protein